MALNREELIGKKIKLGDKTYTVETCWGALRVVCFKMTNGDLFHDLHKNPDLIILGDSKSGRKEDQKKKSNSGHKGETSLGL